MIVHSVRLPVKRLRWVHSYFFDRSSRRCGVAIVSVNLQSLKESSKFWKSVSSCEVGLGSNGLNPSTMKDVARGSSSSVVSVVFILAEVCPVYRRFKFRYFVSSRVRYIVLAGFCLDVGQSGRGCLCRFVSSAEGFPQPTIGSVPVSSSGVSV